MSAVSFCTVTAVVSRNPAPAGGITTAPVTHIAALLITPLWPLQPETVAALAINSPREALECFHVPLAGVALPDVREGDILTVAGVEYPVQSVAEWTDISLDGIPCLLIVVSAIKGT